MTGLLPVLDLRPLQEGHAARGVGRYVSMLADRLPYTDAVVWGHRPLPLAASGLNVVAVPGGPSTGRTGWLRDAARSVRRTDLLRRSHAPVLDVRLGPRPRVVTVLDTIPLRFPELYPAGRLGALRQRSEAVVARHADVVITISCASAEDAERFLGVLSNRIFVVPLAAAPSWPTAAPGRGRLSPEKVRDGRRYVVAAGGFHDWDPRKRLSDLVRTLPVLPADVGLVLTGADGPHTAPLRQLAAELNVADRLSFSGQLSEEQLVELYAGAAAFAFPSQWEGFGLPLLEAMSVGLPCVVSDGGALPEVAGDGATIVPVGDVEATGEALLELLVDATRAAEASVRATTRAADFDTERFATGHLRAYGAA
ncbi:glycosyltransferase family 1 protein [Aeromicrobium sp.]|uniref:glycosyltransferase family 4 protein n=1 Tax=Aeromicrobium sp. TaxID=1871063 RepID=UPI0019A9DCB9|nr:glycosyltransferase family 1 protein [Aeromicrobium sp.]MBC7630438.1 glycosyltransferase family 4 protein [Aeromicrobium sp.]